MNSIVKLKNIEDKIILIREVQVLLDSDVAEIYEVETKRINPLGFDFPPLAAGMLYLLKF